MSADAVPPRHGVGMDDSTAPMAQGNFLRLFFEGSEVRVRDDHGEPWFVLADVCRALGLTNPSVAAQALDERREG